MQPLPTDHPYNGLSPESVWRHFAALNATPRPSRQEAAARDYVERAVKAVGARSERDAFGNVVAYLPASAGCEKAPTVAVQAHLDMVCEKRPEVAHDFATDPIRPRRQGEWIFATGTTLGADNGMGASLALALLNEPPAKHGPLELLFTLEEEIGLHGAAALEPRLVHARYLINLDSEDPRELTIGCAGGAGADIRLPALREAAPEGWIACEVVVGGLKGGHSGVQIHEPLANAFKLLGVLLAAVRNAAGDWRVVRLAGGNARNAIPRDASALILIPAGAGDVAATAFGEALAGLKAEWFRDEPGFQATLTPVPGVDACRGRGASDSLLWLIQELPHGVLAWSKRFPWKVETSGNLAIAQTRDDAFGLHVSTRSFDQPALESLQETLLEIAREAGASAEIQMGYGAWQPQPDSELTRHAVRAYESVFAEKPAVQVIHAGLECGVIAAQHPGMQAISFGPRIEGAHTPEERLLIPTVEKSWKLLRRLLEELAE